MKKRVNGRIFEIDFIRGLAVIFMVYFHIILDLKDFYGAKVNYSSGYNYYIGLFAGTTFIITSGISSTLSRNNLTRGLKVFVLGMVITALTNIMGKGMEIYFGVLHLLGISMILAHFILKWSSKVWFFILIILSGGIIFGNKYVANFKIDYNYLMMLGLKTKKFYSADYYPLVPWFGVFLIGILVGKILYEKKTSYFSFLSSWENNPINFLGRHSLAVYLVHQPIVLLIMRIIREFSSY